MFYNFFAAELI